jgi:DNA-binding IclR family transcriptional regulator
MIGPSVPQALQPKTSSGAKAGNAAGRPPVVRQVPALSRGIAVLRLLAGSEDALGVHDIARALRLVPSTCLHILRVLASERLIAMDPATKKYTVAAGLVALARSALRHKAFPTVVQADLDELTAAHRATAIAVEASGLDHMIVVALARSPSPVQLQVEIGSRFPALISATGRCIAAFGDYPPGEIKARFRKLQWDVPPALAAWQAEVQATRESGFAIDDGQYIRGITIVAAPVGMPNGSINALVVVGLSEQMRELGLAMVGRDLRDRATRLSKTLRDGSPAKTPLLARDPQ